MPLFTRPIVVTFIVLAQAHFGHPGRQRRPASSASREAYRGNCLQRQAAQKQQIERALAKKSVLVNTVMAIDNDDDDDDDDGVALGIVSTLLYPHVSL